MYFENIGTKLEVTNRNTLKLWNPLTDDGDAFRLAVDLNMDISTYIHTKEVSACQYDGGIKHRCIERFSDDQNAAARRAIVRAAAEIVGSK